MPFSQSMSYSSHVWDLSMLVFQIDVHCPSTKWHVKMTPVSEPVFNALLDGTIHFAPNGSLNNHHLIGGSSAESQSVLSTLLVL